MLEMIDNKKILHDSSELQKNIIIFRGSKKNFENIAMSSDHKTFHKLADILTIFS